MEIFEIIKRITPLEELEVAGKKALVRLDLDLPQEADGNLYDDGRLASSLATLRSLLERGARVAVAGHRGNPEGRIEERFSLLEVAGRLAELSGCEVIFSDDCVGDGVRRMIADLRPGSLLVLENLQFHRGEVDGGDHFSRKLAENFDLYVAEAFSCCHLPLASLTRVPRLLPARAAGLALQRSLAGLRSVLDGHRRSLVALLGGSSLAPNAALIEALLPHSRLLLLGGGLAYPFLQARGRALGGSAAAEEEVRRAGRILRQAEQAGVAVLLPQDHLAAAGPGKTPEPIDAPALPAGRKGLDIGPKTVNLFAQEIGRAKAIFWHGSLAAEEGPLEASSYALARQIAAAPGAAWAAGGEACAVVQRLGLAPQFEALLPASAAAVTWLAGHPLPGLLALAPGKGKK